MSELGTCAIWREPAEVEPNGDRTYINSPRAGGEYEVTGTAGVVLESLDERDRTLLTTWLVEQRRLGVRCPKVTSYTLKEIGRTRMPTPLERAIACIRFLEVRSEFLGSVVEIYIDDANSSHLSNREPLAWTSSRRTLELLTLADFCAEEGWIEISKVEGAGAHGGLLAKLKLKPKGYAKLAEIDQVNADSQRDVVLTNNG